MLFEWAILLGIKYFERFLVFFETRCLARINERDITMRKKKKEKFSFLQSFNFWGTILYFSLQNERKRENLISKRRNFFRNL